MSSMNPGVQFCAKIPGKFVVAAFIILLPAFVLPQSTQDLEIYKFVDVLNGPPPTPAADSLYVADIINYIRDTLFLGGAEISNIEFHGNTKGIGLFRHGGDIGFSDGLIISNGYVMTTKKDDGDNKTGAQALPNYDFLGIYYKPGGPDLPPDYYLQDNDMDQIAGYITTGENKPDTAVDPTIITFKFKPYYNSIKLNYVFASEEYKYQQDPSTPPVDPPVDFDLTGQGGCDFLGIFVKRTPSETGANCVASLVGIAGPPFWVPVTVHNLNHNKVGYYVPNYITDNKSFIYDGATIPMNIFPFGVDPVDITPCRTYWMKIGVADYPNKQEAQGYDLSYQMNSAVFLKAYSLMSGYGMQWTFEGGVDNPDFASDSSLVEGGCSNFNLTIKFNIRPFAWDTTYILMKITNASLSEFSITPPLVQDSVIIIYPEQIDPELREYNMTIRAIDDGTNEGTNGIEKWTIRYQSDPCDLPTMDTTGIGQYFAGYSGEIKVRVRDYIPFASMHKTVGPAPADQYFCGNNVTVDIADILTGGIQPYTYLWSHPGSVPGFGGNEQFTSKIVDSPDSVYCTIKDRCTGYPGYIAGKDTVFILSSLVIQASPDFQLCQGDSSFNVIGVQNANVGDDTHFSGTEWYFIKPGTGADTLVGTETEYEVWYRDYGKYSPMTITFFCKVEDLCGNIDYDTVHATFFPVVEIQGVPLICIGDTIELTCSSAQFYEWHKDDINGLILGGNSPVLHYRPVNPGNNTVCVRILNDCGEWADTCFTFFVSQLIMDMNIPNNYNVCPNVPFNIAELNAFDGWSWTWEDNGVVHDTSLQSFTVQLNEAGDHPFTVIAYNSDFCYDTITRVVHVWDYALPEAETSIASVCIDYPTQLSIHPNGPVTFTDYLWTAVPSDASLAGHQTESSPTVTPQDTTTYKCRIRDNHGCYDSATVVVNVRPKLAGTFQGDPGYQCTDKPAQITFLPTVMPLPDATYSWTFGGGGVPAASSQATPPPVIWSTEGLKDITLHIEELGCEGTFTWQYQVYADPVAAFTAINNKDCQPVTASFQNLSTNLDSNPVYLWDFGDGSTGTEANPTHTYPDPGNYNVTLTVTNSTGCTNTLTVNDIVEVYEVPVADFTADPLAATIDNPTINFNEQINIPYALINWDFGDGGTNSGDPSPRHTYGLPGSYFVIMYTETEHGCWDRDTLEIGITEDIKIFIPNVFTPNGDGLNDCFSIYGTTGDIIDVFRIIIYSRWGNEILDAPITNPDCLWDGKGPDGVLLPADSYVYRVFGKNYRGAKKVYEGMITILK